MVFNEYHIQGYDQMIFFLIFVLATEVAASITNSHNVTKGFCDQDQVTLTLTIDCDFTGIYVALHHEKADFSTIILQCGQVTCHSLGSMTYRLTNETLEVFFQFQYREHAGRYVNFKMTCQNQTDVLDQVFLKPCLSGFTGNATLVGSDVIIYCEHSSFNESDTGISITDHEKTLATCTRGTCFGGHSLFNGVYCQVQYKTGMILLCMFDGAVLHLTNSVIAPTATPLSITSTQTSTTSRPESTISTPASTTSTSASTTATPASSISTPESTTSTPASTTSPPASTTSTPESFTSTRKSNTSTPESTISTEANNTLVTSDTQCIIIISSSSILIGIAMIGLLALVIYRFVSGRSSGTRSIANNDENLENASGRGEPISLSTSSVEPEGGFFYNAYSSKDSQFEDSSSSRDRYPGYIVTTT